MTNPFPYGTSEHLGYELHTHFANTELPAFVLWHEYSKNGTNNIADFLEEILTRYGITVAQYCAQYLNNFDTMPTMIATTRARLNQTFNTARTEEDDTCGNN